MLTIDPARGRRAAGSTKLGVALAGGGPLGFFYELGALHALSEAIEGLDLTNLGVYVGVSSGSLIASGLANGFDTTSMGNVLIQDESIRHPFTPAILLRPAVSEYLHRAGQLPKAMGRVLLQYLHDPLRNPWSAGVGPLAGVMPTAVFDNAPMERFLRELFTSGGRTDDFRRLRNHLYVVATNLNTGESVRFGEPGLDHVPISRAVVASAALPGLYPAVEIEGELYVDGALIRTMNASLALEAGCGLVICINPLVPFDASRRARGAKVNVVDGGLPAILGQTFRSLIHSRMQVGMASYRLRFPAADILLLEPDRHDTQLFFVNAFRYADRRRLVNHAYQATRHDLLRQSRAFGALLRRHGLRLRIDVLRDRTRTFLTAATERTRRSRAVTHHLDHALSRLERALASLES